LAKFWGCFPDRDLASKTSEEILSFLTSFNDIRTQFSRHTRSAYLKAFFNFIRNNQSPSDTPMLKKALPTRKAGTMPNPRKGGHQRDHFPDHESGADR
jgi:hypothetical protein